MSFLRKGQFFRIKGERHRVDRLIGGSEFVVTNERTQRPHVYTMLELMKFFEAGQLDFLTDAEAEKKGFNAATIDYSQLNGNGRTAADRRFAYLKIVAMLGDKRTKEQVHLVIRDVAQKIKDKQPPHISTVYRWLEEWELKGRDIRGCVPKTCNRGPRAKKLPSKIFEIIDDTLDELYLKRKGKSIKIVTAHVNTMIEHFNKVLPLNVQLPQVSEATVRREIGKLDDYDVLLARRGRREADRLYRTIGTRPVADRILQYVEVDHTELDILVTCGRTGVVLGRPTLTLAVDRYSRMIVGFYVGFEVPSALAIANCLRNAFLTKSYVKELFPEVQHDWPCCGGCETAVFDNGADFHSQNIETVLESLGINVAYMPVKRPEYKAGVERMFRTLNTDLIHDTYGSTKSNPKERGDDKPEKEACITLETLTLLIHLWVIDDYSRRPHRMLQERPIDVWNRSAAEFPPMIPGKSLADLNPLTAGTTMCTLSNRGITFSKIRYNDDDPCLQKLVVQAGRKPKKHLIRYDASNLNAILVQDPVTLKYLRVPSLSPAYTEGLTIWQHKIIRKIAAAKLKGRTDMASLYSVRVMYTQIVEEAKVEAARTRRVFSKRYARFLGEGVSPIGGGSHLTATDNFEALPSPPKEMEDGGVATLERPTTVPSFSAQAGTFGSQTSALEDDDELDDDSIMGVFDDE